MKNKIAKIFSSFALAAVLTCTGMAAQAAEVVDTEYADTLSIESCAANIKNIYKVNYPDQTEMIDEIVDTLSADSEFIRISESEGAAAFQIVEDSLRDALESPIATYSSRAANYKLPSYTIDQYYSTHCGPASALQALVSNGKISEPSDPTNAVFTAGKEMKTDGTGTFVYRITNYMNKYQGSDPYTYKSKAFTRFSYDRALDFVIYSLSKGRAPVMKVYDTRLMSYYNGNEYSHYVTIIGVNTSEGTITVVDPHFKKDYRGEHSIPISEFYDIIRGDSSTTDGWLSVYTDVAEGEYVYD